MEVWEKMKPAAALALSFVILQLDMLISYVAGPNFRFRDIAVRYVDFIRRR